MAGRSFFRRLIGTRSDAAGLDEATTAPSPVGPTPIPYPNATENDDRTAVSESTGVDDLPDGTSHTILAGELVVTDLQPTAFDEADFSGVSGTGKTMAAEAVFGQRTEVPDAAEVAPTDDEPDFVHLTDQLLQEGTDIIMPVGSIVAPPVTDPPPDDGAQASVSDAEPTAFDGPDGPPDPPPTDAEPTAFDEADAVFGQRTGDPDAAEGAPTDDEPDFVHLTDQLLQEGTDIIMPVGSIVAPPVTDPPPDDGAQALISDDGIVGTNEIISPNNVIDETDDDLILADLSGGSITDQLRVNTASTFDTADPQLADDLDDLDDLDVD